MTRRRCAIAGWDDMAWIWHDMAMRYGNMYHAIYKQVCLQTVSSTVSHRKKTLTLDETLLVFFI